MSLAKCLSAHLHNGKSIFSAKEIKALEKLVGTAEESNLGAAMLKSAKSERDSVYSLIHETVKPNIPKAPPVIPAVPSYEEYLHNHSNNTAKWNASAKQVADFVSQQLQSTGMMAAEANSNAQLQSHFAAVMADKFTRSGNPMLPMEFFNKHTLRVFNGQPGVPLGNGTFFSFAGEKSATSDIHALATALSRLVDGENAETVRQETGWSKGIDGKMRYEISDADAKLKQNLEHKGYPVGPQANKLIRTLDRALVLSDVLDHPALFSAYPNLANYGVTFVPEKTLEGRASIRGRQILVSDQLDGIDVLSSLLHEIQHGIQRIEGFATGGSYGSADQAYANLAGEVEARNTQTRQKMTDAEIKARSPESTQDIPTKDIIITFNGKEMANAPRPANADSRSSDRVINPHTPETLRTAIDQAFPRSNGFAKALEATGKFVIETSRDIPEDVSGARFSKAQENTPEFKKWFGDSKVVDEQGSPLVVYHGTATEFNEFSLDKDASHVSGFWLTDSRSYAQWIADHEKRRGGEAKIIPLYMKAENPMMFDIMKEGIKLADEINVDTPTTNIEAQAILAGGMGWNEVVKDLVREAADKGHDALIITSFNDGFANLDTTAFIAFKSTQIKSATDNTGAFSQTNPDIRYSKDGRILAYVKDGITHFISDNISQSGDSVKGLLLHELGNHALEMGKTDAEFQKLLRQFENMGKLGNQKVKDAFARVPKDTRPDLVREEALGYFLETHHTHSFTQKVIAWFRSALRTIGDNIKGADKLRWIQWANQLSTDDLIYMATQATRRAPETLGAGNDRQTQVLAMNSQIQPAFYSQLRKAFRDAPDNIFNSAESLRAKVTNEDMPLFSKSSELDKLISRGGIEAVLRNPESVGKFATQTQLIKENTRTIGATIVTNPEQAAQALSYLGRGAVERFDALVTDKDGKPLAIVGAFKGALTMASVYPSTIVGEAFRVPNAAAIWFAHNHPSGLAEFSQADRNLHEKLKNAFQGSKIEAKGLFAIAGNEQEGRKWIYESNDKHPNDEYGTTVPSTESTGVPVMERVYTATGKLGTEINTAATAKEAIRSIAGNEPGIVLVDSQNSPVAFIPWKPENSAPLRTNGNMDALYRAISIANAAGAFIANPNNSYTVNQINNLTGLFKTLDVRSIDVMEYGQDGHVTSMAENGQLTIPDTFYQGTESPRATFNPNTAYEIHDNNGNPIGFATGENSTSAIAEFNRANNTDTGVSAIQTPLISLLANSNLSSFLHESGHYFLSVYADVANQQNAPAEIKKDMGEILKWLDINPIPEQSALEHWHAMTLEEQRPYHEKFAETFEQYLFTGKAPSLELQPLFRKFTSWMKRVYQTIQSFLSSNPNAKLDPAISAIFDRMLATDREIETAQAARNYVALFKTAEEGGMTTQEWADYQATNSEATDAAAEQLTARALRELKWSRNLHGRVVSELQKEAKAARSVAQMDAHKEVMQRPIYQAWSFLTGRMPKQGGAKPIKLDSSIVRPESDSMFAAVGRLGGLNKDQIIAEFGISPNENLASGIFGKPVSKKEGGLAINTMAEKLAEKGYLSLDENGQFDILEFKELFKLEANGKPHYSNQFDYSTIEKHEANIESAGRLSEQKLTRIYGSNTIWIKLRDLKMTTMDESGFHPDIIAEAFGYDSGDSMVHALVSAQNPKEAIQTETDRIMSDKYSELATPEAISNAADEAIHNEVRAKAVATELLHLKKGLGNIPVLLRAAKEYAIDILGRKMVKDIKPHVFAAAEARASKAAEKALGKGDREQSMKDKRSQMLNGSLAKEAYAVSSEIKSILRYLKRFDKKSVRNSISADYTDQIDLLLEKYDLRQQTQKSINRRASLKTWVQTQLNEGKIPDISEKLLTKNELSIYRAEIESRNPDGELIYDDEQAMGLLAAAIESSAKQPYQNITVDEFRALSDTVKNIEHLGKLKNTILTAEGNRSYQFIRNEMADSIIVNARNKGKNTRIANDWIGKKAQSIAEFGVSHIKPAIWARIMDGGKDNGPVWRYLIMPANEKATKETLMRSEATEKLNAILRPILKEVSPLDKIGKGLEFKSIGKSLNWQERFAVGLNYGNESNLQRLLDGDRWTIPQVMPVLNSLSQKEWLAIQAVWDHFESYRDEISAKEIRVSGIEPEWIHARPFSIKTSDGHILNLRGGYYPVVFDPRVNMRAGQHSAAEEAKTLMKSAYSIATTRRSFTKTRLEEVHGRPLLLNLQGLYSGTNEIIHDLSWHEWVIDANKLLKSKTIDTAIREHYGPDVKHEFDKWRNDIVIGNRKLDHGIEKAAAWARQSIAAAGLTYNTISAAIQPLGLFNSIPRVGIKWIGAGLARYIGSPIESTHEAVAKSQWLSNRTSTRFRELNELRNQVQGQTMAREVIGHYGYWMMMRTQQIVDVITWWGAYEKAISEGHIKANEDGTINEMMAINIADQAVKDSQGGGEEVDQAGIERGGPLVKLFTVFYSFMNTGANMGYLSAKTSTSKAQLAANMLMIFTVPAIVNLVFRNLIIPGDSGDDDKDKIVKKLLSEQLSYPFGVFAFGRELDLAIKSLFGESKGQSYSGPAGLRLIPDTAKLAQQASQGEFDDAFRKAFINTTGDLTGLPSAQLNRTITGINALRDEETKNPAAIAFGYQKPH